MIQLKNELDLLYIYSEFYILFVRSGDLHTKAFLW